MTVVFLVWQGPWGMASAIERVGTCLTAQHSYISSRAHTKGGHATTRFLEGFLEGSLTASAS